MKCLHTKTERKFTKMTEITSASNPKFKYFKNLLTKKGRSESGEYMVEGFKCVSDAVNSERRVTAVIVCDKLTGRLPECNTEIFVMPSQLTDRLSDTKTPQGIYAVIKSEIKEFLTSISQDWIEDPSNSDTKYKRVRIRNLKEFIAKTYCIA